MSRALPQGRGTVRIVLAVLLMLCSPVFPVLPWFAVALVRAETPSAGQDLSVYLSDYAMRDYVLNCAGCHRLDGKGGEHLGIPDFRGHIGVFTHLPQGREYLFRVPGAAQSLLTDERLAQVLNWMIATYDSKEARQPSYIPFTREEIARGRAQRYDDVARTRRELTRALQTLGLEPAPYTYGSNHPR